GAQRQGSLSARSYYLGKIQQRAGSSKAGESIGKELATRSWVKSDNEGPKDSWFRRRQKKKKQRETVGGD
ncbi:hypothetical protein ACLOJK_038577, partial [Asimina triloba]